MTFLLDDAARHDIQGLVTTGFGHLDRAGLLLLDITGREGGRKWIRKVLPKVTTAAPWSRDDSGSKRKPARTLNVALAVGALDVLGLPSEAMTTLPTEYVAGMAARSPVLGDSAQSAPERWEFDAPGLHGGVEGAADPAPSVAADGSGPRPRRFNALVVVYADGAGAVDEMLDDLRADLGEERGVVEVGVEHGAENTTFKEHFGFSADGLSQPIVQGVRAVDSEPGAWVVRTGEFVLGYLNELGHYPPSPGVAAAHDPDAVLPTFPDDGLPGFRDFGRNGTYVVYRKLHQDVARFWRHLQDSVPRAPSGSRESAMAALAAKYLGRWPSGTPLVLSPDADDSTLGDRNDFMYRPIDPDGLACPVGAHIRRANPRDAFRRIADTAEESIRNSNQHRILRRGVSYGDPLFAKEEVERGHAPIDLVDDGRPRGLHFLAVNSDIQRQFEFVQETWLNNGNFNGLTDNKDPVVGDNDGSGTMTIQRRPVRRRVRDIPRFVHVRGGAYLFLPSITSLRFLGGEG